MEEKENGAAFIDPTPTPLPELELDDKLTG